MGRTLITPAQARGLELAHLGALVRAYLACARPLLSRAREQPRGLAVLRLQASPPGSCTARKAMRVLQ